MYEPSIEIIRASTFQSDLDALVASLTLHVFFEEFRSIGIVTQEVSFFFVRHTLLPPVVVEDKSPNPCFCVPITDEVSSMILLDEDS